MKPLLEKLVAVRKSKGISQSELDDRIGYTNSLVSRWECGDRNPSAFALFVWADALDIDIELVER